MKILLVSDDNDFAQKLDEKLVFLRKNDEIIISDYASALDLIGECSVVLVHENSTFEQTLSMIKDLRKKKEISIILVANSNNENLILESADLGVDDFILANAENFEFVLRIVHNIEFSVLKQLSQGYIKLLKQVNVVDDYSGLFNFDNCQQILKEQKNGIFMAISPCDKMKFSLDEVGSAIKFAIRKNDIAFIGRGSNFYLYLKDTDFEGAKNVFDKINTKIKINAGVADISGKTLENFEKEAQDALIEAQKTEQKFVVHQTKENTLDEWLADTKSGNYKLFRKLFNTKLEKVITPVFYRLQKSYEDKLKNTEIIQFTTDEQCVFELKNKNIKSSLRIIYPGFAKIIVTIKHEGFDSPENSEISLPLDKITQKELVEIVENFIKEYKETKC